MKKRIWVMIWAITIIVTLWNFSRISRLKRLLSETEYELSTEQKEVVNLQDRLLDLLQYNSIGGE